MNTQDIIIIAILVLWAGTSVIYMIHRKKKGKNITCGGDCSKCAGCPNKKS